uniref:Uncharacterized protein n=1 Tax=uncultured marine virus TaxID=186617 RepID=A0A0F7L6N9_9VIRU|nr:hypothetical protein [uncultured marine virus]
MRLLAGCGQAEAVARGWIRVRLRGRQVRRQRLGQRRCGGCLRVRDECHLSLPPLGRGRATGGLVLPLPRVAQGGGAGTVEAVTGQRDVLLVAQLQGADLVAGLLLPRSTLRLAGLLEICECCLDGVRALDGLAGSGLLAADPVLLPVLGTRRWGVVLHRCRFAAHQLGELARKGVIVEFIRHRAVAPVWGWESLLGTGPSSQTQRRTHPRCLGGGWPAWQTGR